MKESYPNTVHRVSNHLLFLTTLFAFLWSTTLIAQAQSPANPLAKQPELKVAVAAIISPANTLIYYKNLLDFIGKRVGRKVRLVQRKTYAEVNDLLEHQEIDLAFVCSGAYVLGKKAFGMELLVAPVAYGEMVYYSYIIVHKESPIRNFSQFRGKIFAFSDPDSNTGCLVPTYHLAKMNESPQSFFKKQIFSKGHDNSIKAVAVKIVDGAAVDQLVWDYANENHQEYTQQTKVIAKFGPFAIPPIVVHPDLNPKLKEKIRTLFLTLHELPEGKKIIRHLHIDQFRPIDDMAYASVREMGAWLSTRKINGTQSN